MNFFSLRCCWYEKLSRQVDVRKSGDSKRGETRVLVEYQQVDVRRVTNIEEKESCADDGCGNVTLEDT